MSYLNVYSHQKKKKKKKKKKKNICVAICFGLRHNIANLTGLQVYNTVMALGYCKIFVSAQYLGKILMELDQVLY